MKKLYFLLLLIPILGACNRNIYSDKVAGADFTNYRTYAWIKHEDDGEPRSILHGNIHHAANREMHNRGFRGDSINPDLLLDFKVKVNKRRTVGMQPIWGMSPWWGWGWGPHWGVAGYHTYPIHYQHATITINAIDQKTNKIVWSGTYSDVVDSRTFTGRNISKTVHKIFKRFPIRQTVQYVS
ncbi:DUF4136 domain-containing protein [Cytophagaceae bacterium ABcell3]|nr:DUF4136 domain-containing protein [Cytophagaceae bacterium ABcell3]